MFEVMLSGNTSTVLGDTLVVLISMTLLLFLVKFYLVRLRIVEGS